MKDLHGGFDGMKIGRGNRNTTKNCSNDIFPKYQMN
jgi:hypothetical protein